MDAAAAVSPPSATSAELQELAGELALALQKRAIYPAGHPLLQGAVERLSARAARWTALHGDITLGIAHHQLIIEGVAVPESHRLLRDLAVHFHEHQVAAVGIRAGVDAAEIEDFLAVVATPMSRSARPLGLLEPNERNLWKHLTLYPSTFEKLELVDDGTADDPTQRRSRAAELWLGLARTALAADAADRDVEYEPERVAGAINSRAYEGGYDEAIVGYLMQLVDQLSLSPGPSQEVLSRRISRLVRGLSPDKLKELLEMGGDRAQRDRFVRRSATALSAGAVCDIINAASEASGESISAAMMRLLRKLAVNAESLRQNAPEADRAVRNHVKRLLSDWTLDDPNPEAYSEVLAGISLSPRGHAEDLRRDEPEPERILEISLDSRTVGEDTELALSRLVLRDGLPAVVERLMQLPESATREMLLDKLLNGAMLREQLQAERPDVRSLEHAVRRLRQAALEPLLAALETRNERDTSWLIDLVVLVGPEASAQLGRPFLTANAAMRRALIAVFERWNVWPEEVDLHGLATHHDPLIRRGAVRGLLKSDATRQQGILIGLRDRDERVFSQALSAAMKGASREAMTILMQRAGDLTLTDELRARAVRSVASCPWPEALQWLVRQSVRRHWLMGRMRLRKKNGMMLAAVSGLASQWRSAPEAQVVLLLAGTSKDDEVRRAAAARSA
jgi:hypothetical protein